MTNPPTFQVSRLREIGWAKWDPIGVGGPDHGWPADEYDTHLKAAHQRWNGRAYEEVADYLIKVETDYMGLDADAGIRSRALDVVRTMRQYVDMLRRLNVRRGKKRTMRDSAELA